MAGGFHGNGGEHGVFLNNGIEEGFLLIMQIDIEVFQSVFHFANSPYCGLTVKNSNQVIIKQTVHGRKASIEIVFGSGAIGAGIGTAGGVTEFHIESLDQTVQIHLNDRSQCPRWHSYLDILRGIVVRPAPRLSWK
jgi:hypothetical protein